MMTKKVLKRAIKQAIKDDPELTAKLAKQNGVVARTVDRWRVADDETLTTESNLDLIRAFLGKPDNESLTEVKETISQEA